MLFVEAQRARGQVAQVRQRPQQTRELTDTCPEFLGTVEAHAADVEVAQCGAAQYRMQRFGRKVDAAARAADAAADYQTAQRGERRQARPRARHGPAAEWRRQLRSAATSAACGRCDSLPASGSSAAMTTR